MTHARGFRSHARPSREQFVHGFGALGSASHRTLRLRQDRQALVDRCDRIFAVPLGTGSAGITALLHTPDERPRPLVDIIDLLQELLLYSRVEDV